ncbi:hypothetical protein JOC75_000509 [Metabacillus crassostreae]|uniref:hypothetical protein n=1 Tax=Metabacillus crassostreae TaxID=929098 RepID=UPI001956B344|nr:hypothetical protein [Metabacillus crassostreae]MBM7602539.1 hypothetical protein [Metabacillus crassostreae]
MSKISSSLLMIIFFSFIMVGCSMNDNRQNHNDTNSYIKVKEVAWHFVKYNGWDDMAKGNWQSAKVTKVIANSNYELLDKTFEGKDGLAVSFEDKENTVVGTPVILIDSMTKKVIGYMPHN